MTTKINRSVFALILATIFPFIAVSLGQDQDPCYEDGGPPTVHYPTYHISSSEAAGARYRKVGLNGFPIPDEKPQQKEESDMEPEESFIDAFNHTLTHQVTDIFIPIQGSDLALTVRRNWQPEIWNLIGGLKPSDNRPDRPFGTGWNSNITTSIRFEFSGGAPLAYVTDTNGVSYRFLMLPLVPGGTKFFPLPENRYQQEVLSTSLREVSSGYEFVSKYGTTLKFAPIGPTVYVGGLGGSGSAYMWARCEEAEDRYGTEMEYSYSSTGTLIPETITCRGKTISIEQSGGRVTKITDPRGKETVYDYIPVTFSGSAAYSGTAQCLETVTRHDETQTAYAYDHVWEYDAEPRKLSDPAYGNQFYYIDLSGITDPNGNSVGFSYAFDYSRRSYKHAGGISAFYYPSGNPRNVTTVSLPGGGSSTFFNNSDVWIWRDDAESPYVVHGARQMTVFDAKGGEWVYDFTDGIGAVADEFKQMIDPGSSSHVTLGLMVFYRKMTVSTPEGGEMVAEFDETAGMALKSFKDVASSEATTFAYEDEFPYAVKFPWLEDYIPDALAQLPTQFWADPTSQTNGEGKTKTFEYDDKWRVMKKITDEEGRSTEYQISTVNGNRLDERIRIGSTTYQDTDFTYADSNFPGIMTRKTVQALPGDPLWASDLVTEYTLESITGNVLKETRGSSETLYAYDANNNKTSTTDPNGNVTTFAYDDLNRLKEVDPPGSGKKELFYDARGNKIREKDENGNSSLWVYDGLNRVIKQGRDMNNDQALTSADIITETTYNPLNAKLTVKSPNGYTTTMTYDGLNRLTKTKDPYNQETLFEYGTNSGGLQFGKDFQPVKITDPRGYQTLTTYDANYRPTEKQVQYAWSGSTRIYATTKWEYDDVGNMLKEYDPLHTSGTPRITQRTYDALNRELSTTWPDSTGTQTFYTKTGLKWKTVDELGNDAQIEYDNQGRPVKTLSPQVVVGTTGTMGRAVTLTAYDAAGNAVQSTNPLGFVWTSTYDARNRKIVEVRPGSGSPTTYTAYDAVGNVIKTTDALGKETDTEYDVANRPVEITQPAVLVAGSGTMRPVTTKAYDKNGNVTSVTDPNGHETINTYDMLNRLVATEDAEGIVVENEYDEVGNRTAVIDGLDQRTEFEYDGLNRNTKITDALNNSTTFAFNAVDKTARVDAMGQRTEYAYDTRHRLTQVSYKDPSGNPVNTAINATRNYVYDATGNLLAVTESAKSGKADVVYSYDALKRQLTETSGGLTHNYRYDLAGNRVYCLYGGLSVPLESTYDAENRLATLTQGTAVTTYTYDANGNNLTKTLPNGDVATSQYDAVNRTTSLIGTTGSSAALYSYAYLYDAVGNVKQVTENYANTSLNRVVTNEYDAINRLTEEEVTGSGALTTTYTYDNANNRESMAKGSATTDYEYNEVNQLTAFTEGSRTVEYEYDKNGNRVKKEDSGVGNPTVTHVITEYDYDYDNRLTKVHRFHLQNFHANWSFAYDYRTRRVQTARSGNTDFQTMQAVSSGTGQIVFSGGVSVREFSGTTPSVDYIRGSDWGGGVGGILYSLRGGVPSFTHYNRRGDVTAKTDGTGAITYQSQYEAYGKRTAETGATLDRQKSNTKDEDIPGYANEGFRFRDLETGTFISMDPAGFVDGPNLYAYVVQNPWTNFDPDGLQLAPFVRVAVEVGVETAKVSVEVAPRTIRGGPHDGATGIAPQMQPPAAINTQIDQKIDPKQKPQKTASDVSKDNRDIVWRGGGDTNSNFTPKEKDKDGLSTNRNPQKAAMDGNKAYAVDLNQIDRSKFNVTESANGHVSISAKTPEEQKAWIDSRPTAEANPHPNTTAVRGAKTGEVWRKPLSGSGQKPAPSQAPAKKPPPPPSDPRIA